MPDANGRIDLSDEVPSDRVRTDTEHPTKGASPAKVSTHLELSRDEIPSVYADIRLVRQPVQQD